MAHPCPSFRKHLTRSKDDSSIYGRNRFKMKQALSEAQNHRCCYCHERFSDDKTSPFFATFEHVIPKSRGGRHDLSNIVLACYTCNNIPGGTSTEDFSNLIHDG